MVVQYNEAGNIYRHRIQLPKEENQAGGISGNHGRDPFDSGDPDCKTVLDQLYHAYAESHEHDPQEIGDGFKELEEYLCVLPLDNNNAVFNLCCRLCSAYERKAFRDGILYGAHLISEIKSECISP